MPQDVISNKDVAVECGFRSGDRGTHTSRTMMLSEFSDLLEHCPEAEDKEEYVAAIVERNVLRKKTVATRRLTAQRLSELYALDLEVPLFRVLRLLWEGSSESQPMLAFLCASARDPLLRLTAEPVLSTPVGVVPRKEDVISALAEGAGDRFKSSTLDKIARNALSSWTQAGHLEGRTEKVRTAPVITPAVTCYALLLGYMCGARGQLLLNTFWCRLLDAGDSTLYDLAHQASRRGLLVFKHIGNVVEVRFPELLTERERNRIRGQD